jgi:hypothetical protein
MPTLTVEYRDESHRIALEQAIAYVTQLRQIAQDGPHGSVVEACEKLALKDGRNPLRSTLAGPPHPASPQRDRQFPRPDEEVSERPNWRLAIPGGRSEKDKASGHKGKWVSRILTARFTQVLRPSRLRRPVLAMIGRIPTYLSCADVTDSAEDATL